MQTQKDKLGSFIFSNMLLSTHLTYIYFIAAEESFIYCVLILLPFFAL